MNYIEEAEKRFNTEQEQYIISALQKLLRTRNKYEAKMAKYKERVDKVNKQLEKVKQGDLTTINDLVSQKSRMEGNAPIMIKVIILSYLLMIIVLWI